MWVSSERFGRVEAIVVERACGGWLAVSVPGSVLRVGATANEQGKVVEEFERTVRKFEALVDEHFQTHTLA